MSFSIRWWRVRGIETVVYLFTIGLVDYLCKKKKRVLENVDEYQSLFNTPIDAVGQGIPREENKKEKGTVLWD